MIILHILKPTLVEDLVICDGGPACSHLWHSRMTAYRACGKIIVFPSPQHHEGDSMSQLVMLKHE